MIQEILEKFNDIVVETEFLNVTKIRDLIHYKCKVQLIDGSNLRISEKWHEHQLVQYSYYWLDDENSLIIGWDNAPHYNQISVYPHHKRIQHQTDVHDSFERDLKTILEFIRQKIGN
mgnify:CR=1 FL=1|jgi:hypothetical protein